ASRVCGSLLKAHGMGDMVCETQEEFVSRAIHYATKGRGEIEILKARALANRDVSDLFDVAKLSRGLEGLYRQMCEEYRAGNLPQPNLANLDSYFEIGVALDHEMREMAAVSDYDEFYRSLLARRHYQQPMQADGRLWSGAEQPEVRPVAKARRQAA
ncbi:MAG TPA: hypothetical protein VG942_09855, partial [Hyphomonadaceae bacterium]|nr:hypothetical protein [Hyphomonadaceae bacterium]